MNQPTEAAIAETAEWICGHARELASKILTPHIPKSLRPRQEEVLEMLNSGMLYRQIAERLGVCMATVHSFAKAHGIERGRGRRTGQYPAELAARDKAIVEMDSTDNYTLEQVGQKFGMTRERVRQILLAHGTRKHSELQHKKSIERAERVATEKQKRKQIREEARLSPSQHVLDIAELYAKGLGYRQIGERLGRPAMVVAVDVCGRYRKRWPHLFPYRKKHKGHPKGCIKPADTRPYHLIHANENGKKQ